MTRSGVAVHPLSTPRADSDKSVTVSHHDGRGGVFPAHTDTDMSYDKNDLTPEQFRVTQRNGTERAFTGDYWDHHEPGIHVDVVSDCAQIGRPR